jgi:heme oxygenase (biliverdin-IX-beta and delta-forming)
MEEQMGVDERRKLRALVQERRWGALGTARDNEPLATWVAFVAERDFGGFILHLSGLSLHTRFLETNPRASLSVSELDATPGKDPQELSRVSFQGTVTRLEHGSDEYERARVQYQKRLFHAAPQFKFGDFGLYRLAVESARYVPGFGQVFRLSPADLREILSADN